MKVKAVIAQSILRNVFLVLSASALILVNKQVLAQVTVDAAWSRATVATTPVGVAYLTMTNKAKDGDILVSASFAGAGRVELHEHIKQGDVMQMRQVKGIAVPAGQSVKLQPSGLHLMLLELKEPLKAGTKIPLVLRFERAGEVKVEAEVRKLGDSGPQDHSHHGQAPK